VYYIELTGVYIRKWHRLRPVPSLLRFAPHRMWRRSHWWNDVAGAERGLGGCATMYADVWSIRGLSKPWAT